MRVKPKVIIISFLAFGLGVAVGIWCPKSASVCEPDSSDAKIVETDGELSEQVDETSSRDDEVTSDASGTSSPEDEPVPEPTVKVVVDNSPAPEPEILAAHAARRARRRAAREAKEKSRQDFLSNLNLDLLTAEQRKVHELYVEANATSMSLRKEISALRATGEDVPAELQSRLADAESVLRADRDAELRALREAAARATGLDETAIRQLMDDLQSIEGVFGSARLVGR